nr:uncharacterized protein LOC109187726 [Ipomoea batatas]
MASHPKASSNKSFIHAPAPTTASAAAAAASRAPASRRKFCFRKRGKLPTARLGGKKPRRGFFLLKLFRRAKLRWLRLHYSTMLKKIKDYYQRLIKDIVDGGGAIDSFHQRLIMETSFAVPVMGLSLNSFPSHYGK